MVDNVQLSAEINNAESIGEFWERAHHTEHPYWLSGCAGPDIWQRLGVTDLIQPGATVLNIGVGLGHCTRALAARGCTVHVLDISSKALDRVEDIARGWLAADIDRIPRRTFDLVLSHLVAQHMTDVDLCSQMKAVMRTLKRDGLFAMQFLSLPGEVSSVQDLRNVKAGSVRRSPERMAELVKGVGGANIRSMIQREVWPTGEVFWVIQAERSSWWQPR